MKTCSSPRCYWLNSFCQRYVRSFPATTALLFILASFVPAPAAGATRLWTGAVNGRWSEPGNWNPAGAPLNGDILTFSAGANRSMDNDLPNLVLSSMSFPDGSFTLGGQMILLGALNQAVHLDVTGGPQRIVTIDCPLRLMRDAQVNVGLGAALSSPAITLRLGRIELNGHDLNVDAMNAGGDDNAGIVEFQNVISGTGDVAVRVDSAGTARFKSVTANTFTGTLDILNPLGGNVFFENTSGPVVTNQLSILDGSVVRMNRAGMLGSHLSVFIDAGGQLLLNGLDQTLGTLVLSNGEGDPAPTTVDTGSGTIFVRGGITGWHSGGPHTPRILGRIHFPETNTIVEARTTGAYAGLNIPAAITGLGGFRKVGSDAVILSGAGDYSGPVELVAGILDVRNATALGNGAGGTVLNGGSLTLRNVTIAGETLFVRGTQQASIEMSGSVLTSIGVCGWTGPVQLDTNLVVLLGDMAFTGPISGPGGLGLYSGGTVRIGGTAHNTYLGTTLTRCPLLLLDKPGFVTAISGPLEVGGASGGAAEVRWLHEHQNSPTNGSYLTVHSNGLVNLNGFGEGYGPITLIGGRIVTGGALLRAWQPITTLPSAVPASIDGLVELMANPAVFNMADGPAEPDLAINATISGGNWIKQGPGTLALGSGNTFTGYAQVADGILVAGHPTALGALSGNTIVANGASLRLGGVDGMSEALQLNGSGFQGTNGALQVTVGGTIFGGIHLVGPVTINVLSGGGLAINSVVSGSGSLIKTGPGNLYLGGVAGGAGNNTYSGATFVSAGTLFLAKNQNVLAVPGTLVVGPSSVASPAVARFSRSGTMPAGGTVSVNANSLLDLNGNNQSLGRLILNDGGDVQTGAGLLSFSANGIVTVGSIDPPLATGASISGRIGLPSGSQVTFNVGGYGPAPLTSEPELAIPANISGVGNIVKAGPGALRLTGNNSFDASGQILAGDLSVNEGTIIAGSAAALGGPAGWTIVNSNAALALINGVSIASETLLLNSTRVPALENWSGSNIWNGPIQLQRDGHIGVATNSALAASGPISGAGGLFKRSPGLLVLAGSANNTHAGNTHVLEGALHLSKSAFVQAAPHDLIIGLGTSNALPTLVRHLNQDQVWARITVNSGGVLDMGAFDEYSADVTLNGGGSIRTSTGTLFLADGMNLIVNPSGSRQAATISGRLGLFPGNHRFIIGSGVTDPGQYELHISAAIHQFSTAAGITKEGGGRLRLLGTNTYTGVTEVMAGTLAVHGLQRQSPVTLTDAVLEGPGTVGHITTTGTGAEISPGTGPGILTCSNFTVGGATTLRIELNGTTPGAGHDQLAVAGPVRLDGLRLAGSLGFTPAPGDRFLVLDNRGTAPVVGTFANLPEGASLQIGSELFQISYVAGTGNDVELRHQATVPPPVIAIERERNWLHLSWPRRVPSFRLLTSTNLATGSWTHYLLPPEATSVWLTNEPGLSGRFFRLVSP